MKTNNRDVSRELQEGIGKDSTFFMFKQTFKWNFCVSVCTIFMADPLPRAPEKKVECGAKSVKIITHAFLLTLARTRSDEHISSAPKSHSTHWFRGNFLLRRSLFDFFRKALWSGKRTWRISIAENDKDSIKWYDFEDDKLSKNGVGIGCVYRAITCVYTNIKPRNATCIALWWFC